MGSSTVLAVEKNLCGMAPLFADNSKIWSRSGFIFKYIYRKRDHAMFHV